MSFSYCRQLPSEGVVSGYRPHSGKYSLLTLCGTGGEHCFGIGGGTSQQVQLDNPVGLKLSLWVYLFDVPKANAWTDIALIADFWRSDAKKTLVYYVVWAQNIPIYDHYPLPSMSSDNVTNLLLHDLQIERWNHIERDLRKDFENSYPDIRFDTIERLQITLLAVTFQRLSLVPKGAFWDDISLTHERVTKPTPTPPTHEEEPTQTPNQIEPPRLTPAADLGQQVPDSSTLAAHIILIISGVVIAVILVNRRNRNKRTCEKK